MLTIKQLALSRVTGESHFQVCLPQLTLQAGDIIVLKGESGCGKSTLLEMIGLILQPDQVAEYQLSLDDYSPADLTDYTVNHRKTENRQLNLADLIKQRKTNLLATIRAHYFGFMLQTGGLLPFLTIKENLLLPLKLLQKPMDKQRLTTLINQLKIAHLLHKYPKQLSIGERQRASFIRSIIHKPALLLADEPTSALDPHNANLLFDLIIEQAKRDNIAAIIVTHDVGLIEKKRLFTLSAQLTSPQSSRFVPQSATIDKGRRDDD
ncbi:ABC transporter ATP-binding protein [Orbaceae bacterium ESL0727]|nr:ABC transporter ATP-binding protein [Orbaceae bacterium ESL0727]